MVVVVVEAVAMVILGGGDSCNVAVAVLRVFHKVRHA